MIDLDDHGPQPGDRLTDRYRIDGILGEGSFSVVYRATQIAVGRPVAIKWMKTAVDSPGNPDREPFEDLVDRFRREAKIVARLDHPATVTLHDFGRTDGDDLYMVLEYVDGEPLTSLHGDAMAPNRVVTLLEQGLESLAEAHDHGIIHRDIKPGNLMIYEHRDRRDRLKILDFGIAKVLQSLDDETLRQITGESNLVGTPRYIAPENATDRDPGPPADIYSLGLVAYELLLGERAVPGGNTFDILDHHLDDGFQVRIAERPAVPEGLRHVVNRMVAKPLETRYATADAVLEELRALPDYGDGYGPTRQVRPPATARSDRTTSLDVADDSTDSLPEVSAFGETAEIQELDPADTTASAECERPAPDLTRRRADDSPEDRTARERPMPPSVRDGGSPRPEAAARADGGGETKPTRRASFPPGQTCEMTEAVDGSVRDESREVVASPNDGGPSRPLVLGLVAMMTAALIAVGLVVL